MGQCDRLNSSFQNIYVLTLRTYECYLYGKRTLQMWLVKNVKLVRLFWITQVDTKYNHQYLYMEKEAEEVLLQKGKVVLPWLRVEEGIMGQEMEMISRS